LLYKEELDLREIGIGRDRITVVLATPSFAIKGLELPQSSILNEANTSDSLTFFNTWAFISEAHLRMAGVLS
jgi:hypothetical protein